MILEIDIAVKARIGHIRLIHSPTAAVPKSCISLNILIDGGAAGDEHGGYRQNFVDGAKILRADRSRITAKSGEPEAKFKFRLASWSPWLFHDGAVEHLQHQGNHQIMVGLLFNVLVI